MDALLYSDLFFFGAGFATRPVAATNNVAIIIRYLIKGTKIMKLRDKGCMPHGFSIKKA